VGKDKIAAVGISASHWITTHGFALNFNPELSFYDTSIIIPCGIQGRGVTSMVRVINENGERDLVPSLNHVSHSIVRNFENIFGVSIQESWNIS